MGEVKWARSATKHHISHAASAHVVRNPVAVLREPPPQREADAADRVVFLGADQTGALLEVMAVELDDDTLLVIHAMPMRAKYHHYLQGDPDA
jgi:uncharacterized DUF497 family protein